MSNETLKLRNIVLRSAEATKHCVTKRSGDLRNIALLRRERERIWVK